MLFNICISLTFFALVFTSKSHQPRQARQDCGRRGAINHHNPASRITEGQEAPENSWPWMVALLMKSNNMHFCGASLINNRWIVTAAHCLAPLLPFYVRVGAHDISRDEQGAEDLEYDCIEFHPRFRMGGLQYDIALIKLDVDVFFRAEVGAVCLPWGSAAVGSLVGRPITMIGWGRLYNFGEYPDSLLEANITVIDSFDCSMRVSLLPGTNTLYPDAILEDNAICTFDPVNMRSNCEGDSGGPLMRYHPATRTYSLAGVVSAAVSCGQTGFPSVHGNIRNAETLQWISDMAF